MTLRNLPFIGNLTHDVKEELITNTASGVARLNFSIAINEGERGTDNEKTTFVPFTAFGEVAENLANTGAKGMRLQILARLNMYKKTVTIDGEEKEINMMSLKADEIAPSLRWASANVTKNAKRGGNGGGGNEFAPDADAPAKKEAPARAAEPAAAPAKAAPAPVVADDDDF